MNTYRAYLIARGLLLLYFLIPYAIILYFYVDCGGNYNGDGSYLGDPDLSFFSGLETIPAMIILLGWEWLTAAPVSHIKSLRIARTTCNFLLRALLMVTAVLSLLLYLAISPFIMYPMLHPVLLILLLIASLSIGGYLVGTFALQKQFYLITLAVCILCQTPYFGTFLQGLSDPAPYLPHWYLEHYVPCSGG